MNLQRNIFQLGYEISPIVLVGGIASTLGNYLPIVALTEPANFTANLLNGRNPLSLDSFFAHFKPMAGSTLIDNDIGMYPFANSSIASNAIIAKPKRISMLMQCPANKGGSYTAKLVTFMALKKQLDNHNQQGGTYIVATPSYIYTDCIMTTLTDVSPSDTKQVQTAYQMDFIQPLISLNQAQKVLNALTSKLTNQLPVGAGGVISNSGVDASLTTPVTTLNPNIAGSSYVGSMANPLGGGNGSLSTSTQPLTIEIRGTGNQ